MKRLKNMSGSGNDLTPGTARTDDPADRPVLLTGATGYVGSRLVRALAGEPVSVRCLARRPEAAQELRDAGADVVIGDLLDPSSLDAALKGVDTAYYLVHSMASSGDFEELDRLAARNFAAAARSAGLRRIVYLGGLGSDSHDLSAHLSSRHEVGELLRESGVPVLELRSSIVLGTGSLSFEMIRALVERLPLMITPRWVETQTQPIAIEDLVEYLVGALDLPLPASRIFEVGGPDRVSYGDLLREYARQRGLKRWMIRVPVLTPRLSSLWLGLVTPLYSRIGRRLVESIRHSTVVEDDSARYAFGVEPRGMSEAIAAALQDTARAPEGMRPAGLKIDSRETWVSVPPSQAFAPIRRIGGENGWYAHDWLWSLRGFLDRLVGGRGLRRGRRDADSVRVGDRIDCWRVSVVEEASRLHLVAELKLPGTAWLQFEVEPVDGGSRIRQTAIFDPRGLLGLAYWYLVRPLHELVFAHLLRGIAREAEGEAVTKQRNRCSPAPLRT